MSLLFPTHVLFKPGSREPARSPARALLALGMAFGSLSLSIASGCGSDGGSQAGTSSVAGTKNLLELDQSEIAKFCAFAERTYKGSLGSEEQYCTLSGLSGASTASECQQYKDQCKQGGDYTNDKNEDWMCDKAKQEDLVDTGAGDCTATVAEAEACLNADAKHNRALASSLTCDDASNTDLESTPECDKLLTKCPGFNF